MVFLRFLRNSLFYLSCAFIVAFFVALFGGAAGAERISGQPVKMDILHFLATGMPVAIVGTLSGTLGGSSKQRNFHLRTIGVTVTMAMLFAVGAQLLF